MCGEPDCTRIPPYVSAFAFIYFLTAAALLYWVSGGDEVHVNASFACGGVACAFGGFCLYDTCCDVPPIAADDVEKLLPNADGISGKNN